MKKLTAAARTALQAILDDPDSWSDDDPIVASPPTAAVVNDEVSLVDTETLTELRATASRFELIVEGSCDGVWFFDLERDTSWFSWRFREMLGLTADEALPGDPGALLELVHPEDRQSSLWVPSDTMLDRRPYAVEHRLRVLQGGWLWCRVHGVIERDPETGRVLRMAGSLSNINAEKAREAGMELSEELFHAAFRTSPDALALLTWQDGRIIEINEGFERLLSVSRDAVVGAALSDHDTIVDPQQFRLLLEQLARNGVARNVELSMNTGVGGVVDTMVSSEFIELYGERFVFVVAHDVSRARELDELLHMSASLARLGGWVYDCTTHEGSWTREAFALIDADPDAFEPTWANLAPLLQPSSRELTVQSFGRAITDGIPFDVELELTTLAGHQSWVRCTGKPESRGGRTVRIFGAMQDITEQKCAELARSGLEAQLRQAQKMESIGQLAGGIAHDFNNLLTAILGYTELLEDALSSEPLLLDDLREVRNAGERAQALTAQLLTFARRSMSAPRRVDLVPLVRDIAALLRRVLGDAIALELELPSLPLHVEADPNQLEQVLFNLAINGRNAMADGGQLCVRLGHHELDETSAARLEGMSAGRFIMLEVRDEGVGMTPEVIRRIFEPFFTTRPVGEGSGLGLSVCYGIVRQAGGAIQVESTPGHGTTMRVLLPAAGQSTGRVAPTMPAMHRPLVLVVEPETHMRGLTVRLLETMGCDTLTAASASAALALVSECRRPLELLVSAAEMTVMNGAMLARTLRSARPSLRVLFTGVDPDSRRLIAASGNSHTVMMTRPFGASAFRAFVKQLLGAELPMGTGRSAN